MTKLDLEQAHDHHYKNRVELLASDVCGCFHCLRIYSPNEIEDWADDGDQTAICAYCLVDSIIGSKSGYPITKEFLQQLYDYWFAPSQ